MRASVHNQQKGFPPHRDNCVRGVWAVGCTADRGVHSVLRPLHVGAAAPHPKSQCKRGPELLVLLSGPFSRAGSHRRLFQMWFFLCKINVTRCSGPTPFHGKHGSIGNAWYCAGERAMCLYDLRAWLRRAVHPEFIKLHASVFILHSFSLLSFSLSLSPSLSLSLALCFSRTWKIGMEMNRMLLIWISYHSGIKNGIKYGN